MRMVSRLPTPTEEESKSVTMMENLQESFHPVRRRSCPRVIIPSVGPGIPNQRTEPGVPVVTTESHGPSSLKSGGLYYETESQTRDVGHLITRTSTFWTFRL